MATIGIDVAHVTPFLMLAVLPPLYKSTITSLKLYCLLDTAEGSSTAKGNVETEALSKMNAFVTRS